MKKGATKLNLRNFMKVIYNIQLQFQNISHQSTLNPEKPIIVTCKYTLTVIQNVKIANSNLLKSYQALKLKFAAQVGFPSSNLLPPCSTPVYFGRVEIV